MKFGDSMINVHNDLVSKREEESQNLKRAEEKAKREAALAAKKAATPTKEDVPQGVFDQFKKAQAGNADEIVNRIKNRHQAPTMKKDGAVTSELANVLARKRDLHTRTPSSAKPDSTSPKLKKSLL